MTIYKGIMTKIENLITHTHNKERNHMIINRARDDTCRDDTENMMIRYWTQDRY